MSIGKLTDEQISEFQEAFNLYDPEGRGFITVNDVCMVMNHLGRNLDETEIRDMINEADTQGN